MRWRAVVSAGVLVLAGCGDEGGTGPPTSDGELPEASEEVAPSDVESGGAVTDDAAATVAVVPADVEGAGRVAEGLVATFGDDTSALAAVLLASDRGYGVVQIIEAGATGRLLADGQVTSPDGSTLVPEYEPSAILDDDVTGDSISASGFRSSPERVVLSEVLSKAGENREIAGLIAVVLFLGWGYSPEQIVDAIVLDAPISGEFEILDDDGIPIVPTRTPLYTRAEYGYDSIGEVWEYADEQASADAAPSGGDDPPATDPPAPPSTDEVDVRLAELVDRAVGVYRITPDLGAHLEGLGDVIWVIPPEGEFVVEPDGTVRGSFEYSIGQGVDGELSLTTRLDRTFLPADLAVLDDGLVFTSEVSMAITWNGTDTETYGETVTGIIDVDIHQLVVTAGLTELDSVRFERS